MMTVKLKRIIIPNHKNNKLLAANTYYFNNYINIVVENLTIVIFEDNQMLCKDYL